MMEAFQWVKVRFKLLRDALECDGDEGCGCGGLLQCSVVTTDKQDYKTKISIEL